MSEKVNWPVQLERVPPFFPGQMGVRGSDQRSGISLGEGVVFYVDPNHGEANDNNDGTDPGAPMLTIQAAVNKCQAFRGDTVAVMPNNSWQYGLAVHGRVLPIAEQVVITVPGVRLVGVSPSGVNGIVWNPGVDNAQCIYNMELDTLIEGFMFTGVGHTGVNAIRSVWDTGIMKGDNLTVRNCVFESTINIAIRLDYVWYADIYQNCFWFNTYGLYVDPMGFGASNLQIHDNIFHECAKAMALNKTDFSHIFRNSIYNHDARMGINATNDGIDTMNGHANMVFENFFSCLAARYNDFCTAGATDAWVRNHLIDQETTTQPT